jgi:hypothetical protein
MSEIFNPNGHIIQDEGVVINQQQFLNFIGTSVTVTDNPGTGTTDVTFTGGGSKAFAYFIS